MGKLLKIPALQEAARQVIDNRYVPSSDVEFIVPNRRNIVSEIDINKVEFKDYPGELRLYNDNDSEIDDKTKATVLRELAENLRHHGFDESVDLILSAINQLDPPQEPIHPHERCVGMVVEGRATKDRVVFEKRFPIENFEIPREAIKVPAFLCDGTRPDWVKDDNVTYFPGFNTTSSSSNFPWDTLKGYYFCVINPIEVQ